MPIAFCFAAGVFALGISPVTAQAREFPSAGIRLAAAETQVGGSLRLLGVQADDQAGTETFALERFEVFAADAEIIIHGSGGATSTEKAPANAFFRGQVEGDSGSRVFLAVQADGRLQGIVSRQGGEIYLIGGDETSANAEGGALVLQRLDPLALEQRDSGAAFTCGNSKLPRNAPFLEGLGLGDDAVAEVRTKSVTAALPGFTARVAIETDYEFYALFNSTTDATNYIGNVIGYASTIYGNEISTSLLVQSVSLWTGSAGSDPWTQTSTFCGLMEFGKYWNVNRTGVSRTIAHFMSGKGLGGGIAWVGVLCSGAFTTGAAASCPGIAPETTGWGGAYGFTASLSGGFDSNNPTVMWDIYAISHEIGHNFNSPHTHCYNGLEGNANPIDQCRSGDFDGARACYSGAQTLPGPGGSGSGTIMSYCHLLSGGYSNISLNFGTGHPYGVQPGREASRMSNHVASTAAGNPSCLALTSALSVTSVAPLSGLTTGGTPVSITGTGFASGATVTFDTGGSAAAGTAVVVVSATTITAVAPAHATGAVRVAVTNLGAQTAFRDNAFFFAPPPVASSFFTLAPCRLIDTRNANSATGGPALVAGADRSFPATSCGIPATAKSISANLTIVSPGVSGAVSVFPGNAMYLGTSEVSFAAGVTRANNALVELATDGARTIRVRNLAGAAVHLVLDVNGYFE